MPKPKPVVDEAKEYQRAMLLKRLRARRGFMKVSRTVGGDPKEMMARYNAEKSEDERELMTSMMREMKGMKRPTAKNYIKDVTKNMDESQLASFREQAGSSFQHMIPSKAAIPDVSSQTIYHPLSERKDETVIVQPKRGFARLNAVVPSIKSPHMANVADVVEGLPLPVEVC